MEKDLRGQGMTKKTKTAPAFDSEESQKRRRLNQEMFFILVEALLYRQNPGVSNQRPPSYIPFS